MRNTHNPTDFPSFEVLRKVLCLIVQAIWILGMILPISSCAYGGVSTDPVMPDGQDLGLASQRGGFTGHGPNINPSNDEIVQDESGHNLWGFFLVYVDPVDMKAEITALRAGTFHINVLKWLEAGPCETCLKIANLTPGPGDILNIDISITHPFSTLNLTGFDVRGIAIFDGSHEFPNCGVITSDRSAGEGELVNADGYTILYNPLTIGFGPFEGFWKGELVTSEVPDSTLNGYRRFFSNKPENTRNAFWPSDTVTVTYEVDMPNSPNPFVFGYAVDANWKPPLTKPVTDPMTQFALSANCLEAWEIEVSEIPIGEGLTDCGGLTRLTIDVYDWQGKDLTHDVLAECPELFEGTITAYWKEDGDGFTRYEAVIWNSKGAPEGTYKCLISKQEDWQNIYMDPSAFQIHTLNVVHHVDALPTAVTEVNKTTAAVDEPVDFDASASHDNDCEGGEIVKYEWDWFNTGDFVVGPSKMGHSWDTPGEYHVQLRVTDDEGNTDTISDLPAITVQAELSYNWTRTFGGSADDYGLSLATDTSGGIYVTGSFAGTVDLDPGSGSDYRTSSGFCDAYLSKFDSSGIYQWGQTWAGASYSQGSGIATDESDYVYDTGSLSGGIIGLRKYDSSAAFQWGVTSIGTWLESCGVAVDSSGNIYVTGYFGVALHTPEFYWSTGGLDAYITKWSSTGEFEWCRIWGKSEDDRKGLAVAVDGSGNVYVTGSYVYPGEDGPIYDSMGGSDIFVIKFNSNGDILWNSAWGGSEDDEGLAITLDESGNLYVTGTFRNVVDFDPGYDVEVHTASGYSDAFLSRFDSSGNFLGVITWGGTDYTRASAISLGESGEFYVSGSFTGRTDFDPTDYTYELTSAGSWDVFLIRTDSSGMLRWVKTWGGTGSDRGYGVDLDGLGNVYVLGTYCDVVDFDPGSQIDSQVSNGLYDIFLSSFQCN